MPLERLIPTHIDQHDESNIIKAAMIYSEDWSGQKLDIQINNQKYQSGQISGAILKL